MHINRLLLMAVLHFVTMYFLMFAMVDRFANVYPNLNNFYMAGIMTTPMLIIEGVLMGAMYQDKKRLYAIMAVSAMVFAMFLFFIRKQTLIGDREFLRSMIPHHAGAILMCGQAPIENADIRELCRSIMQSQQLEINQMKELLNNLRD